MNTGNSKQPGTSFRRPFKSEMTTDEFQKLWRARLTFGILFFSAVLIPQIWQPLLNKLWAFLRQNTFYNLSFFETIQTILCYFGFEYFYIKCVRTETYRRVDKRSGASNIKRPHMRHPVHRIPELLYYVSPILFLDLILIKKYNGVPLHEIAASGGRDLTHVSPTFLVLNFHKFSLQSPVQLWRALPLEAPSSRRIALEVSSALILYDFIFFLIHVGFHYLPIGFIRRLHGIHHNHKEIQPQVTDQLDILERNALLFTANFALNALGAHTFSRNVFVCAFLWMLVENHAGIDVWWGYEKLLPFNLGAGAARHAVHHRTGAQYFQPYMCWADDLLGSYLVDRCQ